MANLRKFRR